MDFAYEALAVLEVEAKLTDVFVPIGVNLPADTVDIAVLEEALKRGQRGPIAPGEGAHAVEAGGLELALVLVDAPRGQREGYSAIAFHVPVAEVSDVDVASELVVPKVVAVGAAVVVAVVASQGAMTTHLAMLPVPGVDAQPPRPSEGAFAMVVTIFELTTEASAVRPLQAPSAIELVALELSLVGAKPGVVIPDKCSLAVQGIILELAHIATAVRPLPGAFAVDPVPEQHAGVDATVGPRLGALPRRTTILELANDGRAAGKAVASGANNLTSPPQALELSPIWPMKCAVVVELAIGEVPLIPSAVSEDLPTMALDVVVVERPLIPRAVRPSELPPPLPDAVTPLSDVGEAPLPLNTTLAVHAPVHPLPGEGPSLGGIPKSPQAILLASVEVADVAVAIWPCSGALAMEGAFLELPCVGATIRPLQLALTPHHVLPPLAQVASTTGPSALSITLHATAAYLAIVEAAIGQDTLSPSAGTTWAPRRVAQAGKRKHLGGASCRSRTQMALPERRLCPRRSPKCGQ
mmetsp:Transcript_6412/g.13132  ORF Transcript_6412/g.13132 Transcript_6412/m.13132 type:complete len:524 (+) Transcript_6412:609-2180(+)